MKFWTGNRALIPVIVSSESANLYDKKYEISMTTSDNSTLPRHPLKQKERLVLLDFLWQRFAFAKTMSQLTASFLKKILNVQVGLFLVATENGPSVRRSVAQSIGPLLITWRTQLLQTATIYKMWSIQKCLHPPLQPRDVMQSCHIGYWFNAWSNRCGVTVAIFKFPSRIWDIDPCSCRGWNEGHLGLKKINHYWGKTCFCTIWVRFCPDHGIDLESYEGIYKLCGDGEKQQKNNKTSRPAFLLFWSRRG